jgi:secretion/DNA translocation related CpaE-like protein
MSRRPPAPNTPTDLEPDPVGVVVLATGDDVVRSEAARQAAAAGCALRVSADPDEVRRSWASATAVLVGADQVEALGLLGLPRRAAVHVVASDGLDEPRLRAVVGLGAETVMELPDGAARLGDLLADLADRERPTGRVVGLVAGSGGVGASVLTVAVTTVADRRGAAALAVDLDPSGAGLDLVAGHDEQPGVDWDSLALGHGRLSSTALRESLSRAAAPSVLGWAPSSGRATPPAAVVGEALAAARRGHDLVAVDSPSPQVWTSCDVVVLVVAGTVHGLAAARRVAHHLPVGVPAGLAVRCPRRSDRWARQAAQALSLPLWAVVTDQRGLDDHLSAGLGPARRSRGAVARAAGEIVDVLGELR